MRTKRLGLVRRLLVVGAVLATGSAFPAEKARLNVLFIAIDDFGNVLGSAGDPVAKTPHLDRLAAGAVRFDRAYCQVPLCNPSRASLLTGLRPDTTSVFDLERNFRDQVPGVVTLPQLFRHHGWFSARVGKIFHNRRQRDLDADSLDDNPSWDMAASPRGREVTDAALIINPTPEKRVNAALSWLRSDGSDEEQVDGWVATEAIKLLEEQREKPFFLGVGFYRPHTPYVAPRKYFDLYPLEKIHLPFAPPDDRADIPPAAFAHNNPTPNYGLDELTCRTALQAYYASVSLVDAQIGRVLDALDRLGLAASTVVVVFGDHGYLLGHHQGAWQKRGLFEESARAPLLIRAPNAKGNGVACRRIVEFVDIYPTLADLCGLTPPSGLAGRSLRPLLENPAGKWDGAAATQVLRPADSRLPQPVMGRTLRTERWRYTEWNEGRAGVELYDHASDPHEFKNLAGTPEAKAIIPPLQTALRAKASGIPPSTPFTASRL